MLSAATSIFNCVDELKRMLSSIHNFMEYIIVVDGRYKGFNYPADLSVDGSREILEGYKNVILIDAPNLKEVEKRQIYLDKTRELGIDLLLTIDSDEYVECEDWKTFEKHCRFEYEIYNKQTGQFGIYVENSNTNIHQFDPRPRIFANPYDIKHTDHRHFVKSDGSPIDMSSIIHGLKLRHDYHLRTESYQELRLAYQKQLVSSEV